MGIKPIDLQTLFVKMDEVSKEQALAKDHSALQQSQAARSQVVRELENDRRVSGVPEGNEVLPVNDEEYDESEKRRRRRTKNRTAALEPKTDKREIVTDPEVGRHVDLSG
jgi:hypothetical protein